MRDGVRGWGRSSCRRFSIDVGSRGIPFVAYVLADDHRMMRLTGRVGRVTERSISSAVGSLRFTRRLDTPGRSPGPVAEARA